MNTASLVEQGPGGQVADSPKDASHLGGNEQKATFQGQKWS